jgi:PilZ domain
MPLPLFRRRRPRAADLRVRLHVPDFGAIDASVERAVVGAAELALRADPPIPTRFLNRAGVMLETIPRDPAEPRERTWGRLGAIPQRNGQVDRRRVWFFKTPPPPPKEPQRRKHVRAMVTLPVTFVPERFEVGWFDGHTRDISVGGALLAGADPIITGEKIRMIVELPSGNEMIDARASVVRELPFGQRAVRIEEISHGDGQRIARLVAELERHAIAEARAGRRGTDLA